MRSTLATRRPPRKLPDVVNELLADVQDASVRSWLERLLRSNERAEGKARQTQAAVAEKGVAS